VHALYLNRLSLEFLYLSLWHVSLQTSSYSFHRSVGGAITLTNKYFLLTDNSFLWYAQGQLLLFFVSVNSFSPHVT
jgi:hypothetical protein